MTKRFDLRLFIILFFAFIVMTIIMTLTHEFGHFIAGILLGHDFTMNFESIHYISPDPNKVLSWTENFWIAFGGPFETMLTGTIGLILLFFSRKSFYKVERLSMKQWILILITLFWYRQIIVLAFTIINFFLSGLTGHIGDKQEFVFI